MNTPRRNERAFVSRLSGLLLMATMTIVAVNQTELSGSVLKRFYLLST